MHTWSRSRMNMLKRYVSSSPGSSTQTDRTDTMSCTMRESLRGFLDSTGCVSSSAPCSTCTCLQHLIPTVRNRTRYLPPSYRYIAILSAPKEEKSGVQVMAGINRPLKRVSLSCQLKQGKVSDHALEEAAIK
jgi:hypothetical protein